MNEIKFYRGKQRHYQYDPSNNILTHKDSIFFATDTSKILVNGIEYGGSGETANVLHLVAQVDFRFDPVTLKNQLILKNELGDQIGDPVNLDIVIPYAKYHKAENSEIIEYTDGLLRGEDKERIDRYEEEIDELRNDLSNIKLVKLETPTEGSEATYQLQGISETVNIEIPVIDRIDSTLRSVHLGTTDASINPNTGEIKEGTGPIDSLIFVYYLDNGKYSLTSVPLEQYVRESEFKAGLTVSEEGTVSVKLSEETADSKNFLVMEDESSLAVREVDADCSKTTEEIVIAGGPLAEYAKVVYPNGKIPSGTDLQGLLTKLFCQELWPDNITYTKAKIVSSLPNLEITVTGSDEIRVSDGVNMFIGDSVSFFVPAQEANYNSSKNNIVSGLSYGYLETNDNYDIHPETEIISTWTAEPHEDDKYTLSAETEGFLEDLTLEVSDKDHSKLTVIGENLIINPGINKISVVETGVRFVGNIDPIEAVYPSSNLGNVDDSVITTPLIGYTEGLSSIPSTSIEFTINGIYPCFHNILDGEFVQTPETRIELVTGNEVIIDVPGETVETHFQFSYPSDRTATLFVKNLDGTFVEYMASYTTDTADTKEFGGIKYNILKTEGPAQGAGTYKIVLGKALNK